MGDDGLVTRIGIIGGGPAGYEAALVAAQYGAEVTLVERTAPGGACVIADCVPSKTLIAAAEAAGPRGVDLGAINARVLGLATRQSADIDSQLREAGVSVIAGDAYFVAEHRLRVEPSDGGSVTTVDVDAVLIATGARPRVLQGAEPDGERILSWRDMYNLDTVPEHLLVVGSGVTGAEFAAAYLALGGQVTLISSRDRVLPGEDPDAANVLQSVLVERGMTILTGARAQSAQRTATGVTVTLSDGRKVSGSHVLMAVGSIPNTDGLGVKEMGVAVNSGGFITVDRVSRTTVPGIYAAGDCTGVLMLASVAAMQGRIAMWHVLGMAVAPLRKSQVAANVFTDPQIATVGVTQRMVDEGTVVAQSVMLDLERNARAKMVGVHHGIVKLFAAPGSGTILGGVVVGPDASEMILAVSLAVANSLTVDQLAHTFAIYPSMSGTITEAARQLMPAEVD